MIAQREVRTYSEQVKVWVGKYKNSHNLLHWHYDCELLYVDKGSIDVFCGKQTHRLLPGEALYVDSEQVHYMQALDPETILTVLIFDYEILRPYMGDISLACPKLSGRYPVPQTYREIRDLLLEKPPFYAGEAVGKIISLMASIFRGEPLSGRRPDDRTSKQLIGLLEAVSSRCDEFSFGQACEFMGMSDAYFSRYFKKATGITFSQYLNYARTQRAVSMLSEREHTMTEIACACGFGTIRNFNRIFKQFTGYAPSELPAGFSFSETFVYPSEHAFNPTLHDCELIESGET